MSAELAAFLTGKIHAEFLPTIPTQGQGVAARPLKILHFLDTFAALDRSRSEFKEYDLSLGGGISEVSRLVIDKKKVAGSAAFRLEELATSFFRQDVCDDILAAGFRGLRFTPEDQFRFGC